MTINPIKSEKQHALYVREIERLAKKIRVRKVGKEFVVLNDRNKRKLNLFTVAVADWTTR